MIRYVDFRLPEQNVSIYDPTRQAPDSSHPKQFTESAHARALAAAIRSMTPDQTAYKGLTHLRDDLLNWLDTQALHSNA